MVLACVTYFEEELNRIALDLTRERYYLLRELQRTLHAIVLGMWTKAMLSMILCAALSFAADVTGKWTFEVTLSAGSGTPIFAFVQKGSELTGTYEGAAGTAPLSGKVEGDKIEFVITSEQGKIAYSGTILSSTSMKGTATYGEMGAATWTAQKETKKEAK